MRVWNLIQAASAKLWVALGSFVLVVLGVLAQRAFDRFVPPGTEEGTIKSLFQSAVHTVLNMLSALPINFLAGAAAAAFILYLWDERVRFLEIGWRWGRRLGGDVSSAEVEPWAPMASPPSVDWSSSVSETLANCLFAIDDLIARPIRSEANVHELNKMYQVLKTDILEYVRREISKSEAYELAHPGLSVVTRDPSAFNEAHNSLLHAMCVFRADLGRIHRRQAERPTHLSSDAASRSQEEPSAELKTIAVRFRDRLGAQPPYDEARAIFLSAEAESVRERAMANPRLEPYARALWDSARSLLGQYEALWTRVRKLAPDGKPSDEFEWRYTHEPEIGLRLVTCRANLMKAVTEVLSLRKLGTPN